MAAPTGTSRARVDRAMTAHYTLPGLLGSTLVALGALGVGWLPANSPILDYAVVATLRSTTAGEVLSRVAVFAGVALLLQAWLVLGHDVLDNLERSEHRLVLILTAWTAPLLLMPPLFSRDAYSYFAQGQLVLAGLNPYDHGVSALPGWFLTGADPLWAESPTPYGPAFLILQGGVAALAASHAFVGALLFRLIALTGIAMLVVYLPRLAHAHGIEPPKAVWLTLLNPLVLMHFVAGAHNDALMVGLMVAGLALAVERHPVLGIVLIGMAGAVKPIGLVVLPFAGLIWAGTRATWTQRIWAWVKASLIVLAVFAVLSLVVGVGLGLGCVPEHPRHGPDLAVPHHRTGHDRGHRPGLDRPGHRRRRRQLLPGGRDADRCRHRALPRPRPQGRSRCAARHWCCWPPWRWGQWCSRGTCCGCCRCWQPPA